MTDIASKTTVSSHSPIVLAVNYTNLDPRTDNVYKKEVVITTYNEALNPVEQIVEGQLVVPDNFTPQSLDNGVSINNKFLLRFQGSDYGLKFHLPQGNESAVYMTFCKMNTNYHDGWEDYTTNNLPAEYTTAFASWAHTFPIAKSATAVGSHFTTLRFKSSGRQSTGMDNTLTFKIKLKYYRGAAPIIAAPIIAAPITPSRER